MKILFRQYLKFTQAVLAMFMVTHFVAEPMALASHNDIAIFREMRKQEITAQKAAFGKNCTNLDVVVALRVLENDLAAHIIDELTFSRYALGMMIGNGFPDGVTTGLKATKDESIFITSIIQKAAAHGRNLQFSADQIWSAKPRQDAVQKHAHILNDLSNDLSIVPPAEPSFEYKSRKSQKYDLDQILKEICASFDGTPAAELMNEAQKHSPDPTTKDFVLAFYLLSEFEQSEIIDMFNRYQTDEPMDAEEAFNTLALSCTSVAEARLVVERHVLEPIQPLIDAIPAGQIQSLDHLGSALAQRNAIRAFLGALEDLGFSANKKEICLNALFRKLNPLIPAAAHAIAPAIQALIYAIPLKPVINNRAEAGKFTLSQYALIKTCIDAIKRLEPIWQDIHYRELIEKIKRMHLDAGNTQINTFNDKKIQCTMN